MVEEQRLEALERECAQVHSQVQQAGLDKAAHRMKLQGNGSVRFCVVKGASLMVPRLERNDVNLLIIQAPTSQISAEIPRKSG